MSVPTRLAAFALALVVVFGTAFGLGRVVGPDHAPTDGRGGVTTTEPTHQGHREGP